MRHLIALMLTGVGCAVGICWSQPKPSEPVDLCTVAADIQTYNGQQVRVTAFLGVGAEQDVLYDPKCRNGEPLVYVSFKPKVTGKMKALRRIVQKKRYALVTVEGTMHGPEPVKIDPKLPDWVKDRFKDSQRRYGHLDSLEMMIEVGKVIEARDVDDGTRSKASVDQLRHKIVRLADGTLVTVDNTRLLAASAADINVQAVIHEAGDMMSPTLSVPVEKSPVCAD